MIKVENVEVFNFEGAIRGMRNPMNSWDKSDSIYYEDGTFEIGENDLALMKKLTKAGSEHRKYLRQIFVCCDISAALFWWKEFDTYKIGTVANSTSFMHKGISKPFDITDFDNNLNIDTLYNGRTGTPVEIKQINEEWKDIIGYEDLYKISNMGRIISKEHKIVTKSGYPKTYPERELKKSINSSGYYKVILRKNGVGKNFYLHRLLATHFIPNPNNLPEVNHKDGNKLNYNLDNLEWISKSDNSIHAFNNNLRYVTGYNKTKVGEGHRRFSEDDVNEIRSYYNDGWAMNEIAEYMNCYDSTINNIIHGQTYNTPECEAIDDWKYMINRLNTLREEYLETKDKKIWEHIVRILPCAYIQKRTITMNYENVINIIRQRNNHKLDEWREFCKILNDLPYIKEITGGTQNESY